MSDKSSEIKDKAFDFAAEVSKQLITLATAIITVTLTFSDDIIGDSSHDNTCLILWSWIAFLLSICFGILSLMAMTGILGKSSDNDESITRQDSDQNNPQNKKAAVNRSNTACRNDKGIYSTNVTKLAAIQIIMFIVAIVLSVMYGYKSLTSESFEKDQKETPIIINSTEYRFESSVVDTVISKSFKTYKHQCDKY